MHWFLASLGKLIFCFSSPLPHDVCVTLTASAWSNSILLTKLKKEISFFLTAPQAGPSLPVCLPCSFIFLLLAKIMVLVPFLQGPSSSLCAKSLLHLGASSFLSPDLVRL